MKSRTVRIRIVVEQKDDNAYSSDTLAEAEVKVPGAASRSTIFDAAIRTITYALESAETVHGKLAPLAPVEMNAESPL